MTDGTRPADAFAARLERLVQQTRRSEPSRSPSSRSGVGVGPLWSGVARHGHSAAIAPPGPDEDSRVGSFPSGFAPAGAREEIALLSAAWPSLSPSVRQSIVNIVRALTEASKRGPRAPREGSPS